MKNIFENLNTIDKFLLRNIKSNTLEGLSNHQTKDLLRASQKHGVFPYLYKSVRNSKENTISNELRTKIEDRNRSITKHTAKLVSELKNMLSAFEQENIPVAVLKGVYLSEIIYPELDLRVYTDIDVLVSKENLSSTTRCLESIGFEEIVSNKALEEKEKRGQTHFTKPGVMIDLHWEIINDGLYRTTMNYKTEAIFDNCTEADFFNHKILELSPTELIIYLATHLASQHAFARLMWFNDLHCALEKFADKIHWNDLIKTAKKRFIAIQVYYSLLFTQALMNSQVPKKVLDELRPKHSLAKLFEVSIRNTSIVGLSRRRRNLSYQIWLILRDNWNLSLKALKWRLFPSVEWFLNYYPFLPKISPAYYRPIYPLLIMMRLFVKPRMNLN